MYKAAGKLNDFITVFTLKCWTNSQLNINESYKLSEAMVKDSNNEPGFIGPVYGYNSGHMPVYYGCIMLTDQGLFLVTEKTIAANTFITCCATFNDTNYHFILNTGYETPTYQN